MTVISSAIDGTPHAGLEWRHGGSPAATSRVTPGAAATKAGCAAVAPGAGTSTAGFAMFTVHSYAPPSWSVSVWPTDSVTTDPLSASVTVVAGAALGTVVGPGVASGTSDGGGVRRTGTGVPAGPSDGPLAFGGAGVLGGATVIPMVAAPPGALGAASGAPEVPGTAVPAGPAPDAADAASGRAVPGAPPAAKIPALRPGPEAVAPPGTAGPVDCRGATSSATRTTTIPIRPNAPAGAARKRGLRAGSGRRVGCAGSSHA